MENILAYAVIFIFGLSVVYAYQWKKRKERTLPVSIQNFSNAVLEFLVVKRHGKTQELRMKLSAKSELTVHNVHIELIDRKRNITVYTPSAGETEKQIVKLEKGSTHVFHFQPDSLVDLLSKVKKKGVNFRFVVVIDSEKKLKTHELAFNTNWAIYRPDSGVYN